MITPTQRAEMRRLYFGEHWKIGTIAAVLGVHHETVRAAVLHETGGVRRGRPLDAVRYCGAGALRARW